MAGFMDAIRKTLNESTPVTEIADQQTMQPESAEVDVTELALSEQPIDELSRGTLGKYVKAASKDHGNINKISGDMSGRMSSVGVDPQKHDTVRRYDKLAKNRSSGINTAVNKLTGSAKVNAEEVEQVDELSKKTLASYVGKASQSAANIGHEIGQKRSTADDINRFTNRNGWGRNNEFEISDTLKKALGADNKSVDKLNVKAGTRLHGISKAAKKLSGQAKVNASEEVENIEELSAGTLRDYSKSATKDFNHRRWITTQAKTDADKKQRSNRAAGIALAKDKLKNKARVSANEENEMDEAVDLKDVMKYAAGGKKFDRKSLIQKKIAANNAKKAETKEEVGVDESTAAQDSLHPAARSIDDPKSKFAVIQQAIGAMHAMSKDDLVKWFNDTLAQVGHEADKVGNNAASNAATLNMKPSAASSAQEDVEALFAGQDLTEEFKSNATTLFEAAVGARVAEEVARIEEQYEEALSDAVAEAVEELTDQIDKYFDYAVEAWLEENEVAIESALRSELTEEFISGLRNLFLEHNIYVPDESVDVVEELAARVDELEAMLNDQIAENIDFKNALLDAEIEDVVESAMEGLTLTQKEKFRTMLESIEFNGDVEELNNKLALIKKTYFTEQKKPVDSNIINESFEGDAIEKVAVTDPNIARYVSAIGRTVRRP